jgi:uncharacterized Rmd1/YagE family protein
MTRKMWQRTKVLRRIILYVGLLAWAIFLTNRRKPDLLDWAFLGVVSFCVIVQLFEDITSLRRSRQ